MKYKRAQTITISR